MKELKNYTFKILSMGCKVNFYECEAIKENLISHGLILKDEKEPTDISIINTCTVTEEGSRKSKQMIRRLSSLNKEGITCVIGCLAQIDKTIEDIENVKIVIGTTKKETIYDCLLNYYNNLRPINLVDDERLKFKMDNLKVSCFKAHTRAFLKVQDGCNNYCSYCIIPYARGISRSKPIEDCINEAKELVNKGHKEIVVTGIDTGSYGKDINSSFFELLKELDKIDGLLRIRISSLELSQISDDIINLIKNSNKIVHHLHIPLQNGSNSVLKSMNRHYTKEEFIEKIDYIRKEIPDISITTDYISGYPTETEECHIESLETLRIINFNKVHAFPYSIRTGTVASKLKQVDIPIRKRRNKEVIQLSDEFEKSYSMNRIGNEEEVLFETLKDGYVYGHTGTYLYVKAKGTLSDLNKMKKVILKEYETDAIIAEIMKD